MRLDKLNSKFQLALSDAQSIALGLDHQYIEATHVLLPMLNQDGRAMRRILSDLE
ncbi:Clp protease N-terminal domain-containing protein, partial [Psychromonas arctica]